MLNEEQFILSFFHKHHLRVTGTVEGVSGSERRLPPSEERKKVSLVWRRKDLTGKFYNSYVERNFQRGEVKAREWTLGGGRYGPGRGKSL